MNIDAEYIRAENGVLRLMLLEICEALVVRGSLTRDDIAGALLRTEFGAEILDGVAEEEGDITHPHAGIAKLSTEQWRDRFGIEPSIYALRASHTKWLAAGQVGPAPLDPEEVRKAFDDDE